MGPGFAVCAPRPALVPEGAKLKPRAVPSTRLRALRTQTTAVGAFSVSPAGKLRHAGIKAQARRPGKASYGGSEITSVKHSPAPGSSGAYRRGGGLDPEGQGNRSA